MVVHSACRIFCRIAKPIAKKTGNFFPLKRFIQKDLVHINEPLYVYVHAFAAVCIHPSTKPYMPEQYFYLSLLLQFLAN